MTSKTNPSLSIVIPAFNETRRLRSSLEKIMEHVADRPDVEILLVDDGSSDGTADVARDVFGRAGRSISSRVISHEHNSGKGHAVRVGLLAAVGEIALFSDADLSTPISEMGKLIGPISSGEVDVAFGSRALDRSLIRTHQTWRREQGGKVFNLVVRRSTALPFWDTQCGFKAFRSSVFRPILEVAKINRFGFDVELLFVAHTAGLRLREIPVAWSHVDGSKVKVIRDSVRMINEVMQIRRNMKRGDYETAVRKIDLITQHVPRRSLAASA